MLGRFVLEMLALVVGLFGQIAFFADFGRTSIPVGVRVAAHLAVVLPFFFAASDGENRRRARLHHISLAVALSLYTCVSLASIVLALAGVSMHGLGVFLALEIAGAIVAVRVVARALRALRKPQPPSHDPLFVGPWVGPYRTRPMVSPPPTVAATPARLAPRAPIGSAILTTAFAVVGASMIDRPRHTVDQYYGVLNFSLFGFAAWTFWEQVLARTTVLPVRARRRLNVGLALVGVALVAWNFTVSDVPLGLRALTGALASLVVSFAVRSLWRQRNDQPARSATARRSHSPGGRSFGQ